MRIDVRSTSFDNVGSFIYIYIFGNPSIIALEGRNLILGEKLDEMHLNKGRLHRKINKLLH